MNAFSRTCALALMFILGGLCNMSQADFLGKPPLGPTDKLRQELLPYDLAKLNCLGINYIENLCDMRVNLTSYTHLDSDINAWDAWHLQFPDDTARNVEGLAWEAQYSPVVRLELARRLMKGLMAAHVPGTRAYYFFRHRSAGKTFLIFDDQQGENEGRLTVSNWGDSIEGALKIGFRTLTDGQWQSVESFEYTDTPPMAGHPSVARLGGAPDNLKKATSTSPNWNESPFVFKRHYSNDAGSVDFTGRYWFSDGDMPLEYTFQSADADSLEVVVGKPGEHMHLLRDKDAPGFIHLPDRQTVYRSDKQGELTLESPAFNYIVLRKATAWACPGYSTALLVMWEGNPESVTALAENGYGQIRVRYGKQGATASGRVWLYPFDWVNDADMAYIYRNAESFLTDGKLIHNGFPSQQNVNALPTGLAAGAWLLTKYNDPSAATARIQAENAVDAMLMPEDDGKWFIRSFYEVKAAAWMVKLGKLTNDQRLIAKYTPWVERIMERLLSSKLAYDGKALGGDGWTHFNSMKAVWLAWEATGREDYREAYERGLTVYTIDEKGIYKYGEPLKAPGGFDTYSGALPLGEWGHAGQLDDVAKLINLDVPNGWGDDPTLTVAEVFHDGGAGPWAQDDSQPDFIGYCLRGLNLPTEKQYLVPAGSGAMYDPKGEVTLTGDLLVENPFFLKSSEKLRILDKEQKPADPRGREFDCAPGDETEQDYMINGSGTVTGGKRVIKNGGEPVVYAFPAGADTTDAALDMTLSGDAYQVAVSADGRRWHQRLDSWSDGPERRALDVSFLTGSPDELIAIERIDPASDGAALASEEKTRVERGHCRYVDEGGSFVYKLALNGVTLAQAEVIVGNGYHVEVSADGQQWQEALNAAKIPVRDGKHAADAAWLRMVDLTPVLGEKDGDVYIRFSDLGQPETFGGKQAFLRRLTVYGVYKADKIYVRLTAAGRPEAAPLTIDALTLRTWSR